MKTEKKKNIAEIKQQQESFEQTTNSNRISHSICSAHSSLQIYWKECWNDEAGLVAHTVLFAVANKPKMSSETIQFRAKHSNKYYLLKHVGFAVLCFYVNSLNRQIHFNKTT